MFLHPIEDPPFPPDNHILSVSAFTRRVKSLLEGAFPEVWIRGEISNFRRQSSGHCYFSLKDEKSQVGAVLFRGNGARLSLDLRPGLQIIAYGQISVYEPRGNYQLIVRYALEDGAGQLQIQYERLKRQLAEEGLFDPARKKPIPLLPRRVGFITSPTGAAVRDFISILKRRGWRGHLLVLPVKVQGGKAAGEIAEMLTFASQWGSFDLIVIGRGGGSLEDLWPFNEERVARAVAACPLPVISAVGHEIDFTLSDLAADQRAETPSAAAEIISSGYLEFLKRAEHARISLFKTVLDQWERLTHRRELSAHRLAGVSPQQLVEHYFLRLDDLENRLGRNLRAALSVRRYQLKEVFARLAALSPKHDLKIASANLRSSKSRINRALKNAFHVLDKRLQYTARRLRNASPPQILKRGFVLVEDETGNLISRRKGLRKGRRLTNRFADGTIEVEVKKA